MNRAAIVRVPTLGLTAAAAAMASSPVFAAEWTFAPSAQVTSESQDNPRMLPEGSQTESSLAARAAFQLRRQTESLGLVADASLGTQRDFRDSGLDRSDQHVDLVLHWQGNEHIQWTGSAAAARDTTLTSELGVTGQTEANERHETYDFSLGPSWQATERLSLGSTLGWQVTRYPDRASDLSDYRYGTADVSATYALTDRASVSLVGAAGRFLATESMNDSDSANVRVQAAYALSTLWSLSGGAGPSWVSANGRRSQGLVFNFALGRRFDLSSLSLSASRSQSPSGFGLMTDVDDVGLSYSRQLGERLSGSVSGGYVRRRDALPAFDIELQEVRYRYVDASFAWAVTPGWQVVFGAGNRVQRVGTLSQSGSAQNYEARFTLSWTGNPHVY